MVRPRNAQKQTATKDTMKIQIELDSITQLEQLASMAKPQRTTLKDLMQPAVEDIAHSAAAMRAIAEETPKQWVLPKRGDKVKLIKEPHADSIPKSAGFIVGTIYEVCGVGVWVPPDVNNEYSKNPNYYAEKGQIALAIPDISSALWHITTDCLEPA